MSRSMNRIENINNTISVKQDDTGTVVQLKIYDYDGNPVDLKNPDIDKIEVKIGAIGRGFHTIKTPTLLDETGALEFRLDVDDKVPAGTNDVEVHVYYKNGRKRIFPAEGAYKFKVSKSLDAVGKEVFKVTVDYLLEQFDNKKQEIEDEAAALREEIENAIQYVDESITEVRQEFNEQLDQTVDNKMTPFVEVVEVVNEHLAEFETLLSENAIMHNNIYRGKYLGSSVTPEQYQAISSGTFEDLYIGDYWSINGVNYRIAGFDYYYITGDTVCTTHHAVIVPDTVLYTHPMNDTNTTEGGYVNSKMYTEGLAQALSTIKSAFSGHVLKHRRLLSNATSNGKASGWAWFDSEVELMTEIMVYGSVVWGESTIGGSGYNIGVDKSQLPLFKLNPRMINTRQSYWLRDVVSDSHFAYAGYYGNAYYGSASDARGVRPAFSIS